MMSSTLPYEAMFFPQIEKELVVRALHQVRSA